MRLNSIESVELLWPGTPVGKGNAMTSITPAAAARAELQTKVGVTVLKAAQDAAKLQGNAAVELLEDAAQLSKEAGKGNHVDLRV